MDGLNCCVIKGLAKSPNYLSNYGFKGQIVDDGPFKFNSFDSICRCGSCCNSCNCCFGGIDLSNGRDFSSHFKFTNGNWTRRF